MCLAHRSRSHCPGDNPWARIDATKPFDLFSGAAETSATLLALPIGMSFPTTDGVIPDPLPLVSLMHMVLASRVPMKPTSNCGASHGLFARSPICLFPTSTANLTDCHGLKER